jgi:hypothetical protein
MLRFRLWILRWDELQGALHYANTIITFYKQKVMSEGISSRFDRIEHDLQALKDELVKVRMEEREDGNKRRIKISVKDKSKTMKGK